LKLLVKIEVVIEEEEEEVEVEEEEELKTTIQLSTTGTRNKHLKRLMTTSQPYEECECSSHIIKTGQ